MKNNIKTYRYLANVYKNHYQAYIDGKLTYEFFVYSTYTKLFCYKNPYQQANLNHEIIKLIGLKNFAEFANFDFKNNFFVNNAKFN